MRAPIVFALGLLCGCAPEPESDPSVVRDLRVLAISVTDPGTVVPLGPPDDEHPVYTFAEAPAPLGVRVLVVDPRAPRQPVRYSAWACQASTDLCEPGDRGTFVIASNAVGVPEELAFEFAPTAELLNTWLEQDRWKGYDRLFVRLEVAVTGFEGMQARAQNIIAFYGPTIQLEKPDGGVITRTPFPNPKTIFAQLESERGAVGVNLLTPQALLVEPGERLTMEYFGDGSYIEPMYTLPTAPDQRARRTYRPLSDRISLYAVHGRVSPAQSAALIGNGFAFDVSEAAEDFPDALYIVAHNALGGCAWARWDVVTAPAAVTPP